MTGGFQGGDRHGDRRRGRGGSCPAVSKLVERTELEMKKNRKLRRIIDIMDRKMSQVKG